MTDVLDLAALATRHDWPGYDPVTVLGFPIIIVPRRRDDVRPMPFYPDGVIVIAFWICLYAGLFGWLNWLNRRRRDD